MKWKLCPQQWKRGSSVFLLTAFPLSFRSAHRRPPSLFTPQYWQMGQTVGLWCQWVGTAAEVRTNGRKEEDSHLMGRHDNSSTGRIGEHWKNSTFFFFLGGVIFKVFWAHVPRCCRNEEALWLSDPSQTRIEDFFFVFFLMKLKPVWFG